MGSLSLETAMDGRIIDAQTSNKLAESEADYLPDMGSAKKNYLNR